MRTLLSILIIVFLQFPIDGVSQGDPAFSIDFKRLKLHEDIDQLQSQVGRRIQDKGILKISDSSIRHSWFADDIDALQKDFEMDRVMPHRLKVKYLTGLILVLRSSLEQQDASAVDAFGMGMLNAYRTIVEADRTGKSFLPFVKTYPLVINQAIFGGGTVFFDHPEIDSIKVQIYLQFADKFPEKVLPTLTPFLNHPIADSLIILNAKLYPSQFYDYASASNSLLGNKMKLVRDTLVQLLYGIAQEKSGRMLFPFVPLILDHQVSYEDLKSNTSSEVVYFSKLVQARITMGRKTGNVNNTFYLNEMDKMITRKAEDVFINLINLQHELDDSARFEIVKSFSFENLYYLIISGENTLYTSSYLGMYKLMMERCPGKRGDLLLESVGFDHFRKFIKMAASYNRLNDFLSTMPDSNALTLTKKFVSGLDHEDGLAEAVDVADAYASIDDPMLKSQIRNGIVNSLGQSQLIGNKEAERIYALLNRLFDTSRHLQQGLDSFYHVCDVFNVAYRDLADISGKVIEQVFFYGDEDGRISFEHFMDGFRNKSGWKIVEKEHWVEIRSLIGKSIWIFANRPDVDTSETEVYSIAQQFLNDHLDSLRLSPTILVHRGHSYFLKQTINQFPAHAKIILAGSCGGFQLLNAMLEKCKGAHIISTKEVGTKAVNDPILLSINDSLRKGLDINWIDFWKNLETQFASGYEKSRFENYIPPHKNLGAIFIKAFSSITEKDNADFLNK